MVFLITKDLNLETLERIQGDSMMQKVDPGCPSTYTQDPEWFFADRWLADQMF